LLGARLALAAVFLLSGLAKLGDRRGSVDAAHDLGVPSARAAPVASLLVILELAVAVALVPTVSARWAAVGASVLLLGFSAAVAVALIRGRRPNCHCFGQLSARPIGARTLARNGLLLGLAAFVLVAGWRRPGGSAVAWWGPLSPTERASIALGAFGTLAACALAVVVLSLMRQNGRILLRLGALEASSPHGHAHAVVGLPVGATAPEFALPNLSGEVSTLQSLRADGKPVMLLFTDPHCEPCAELLPEVAAWQRDHDDGVIVAVISRGGAEENGPKAAEHGLSRVLLQSDFEAAHAYQADATPSAVLVASDGTVASPLMSGADAIRSLISALTNGGMPHSAASLPIGSAAPGFSLPNLDGRVVDLSEFGGAPTLLLFWRPGCGFCQQMLDALKAWEERHDADGLQLLVVSSESIEANREMGLHAEILLDDAFGVGASYGVTGTPSAILVDDAGQIASGVAIGERAVFELAGGHVQGTEPLVDVAVHQA
jgi:methylamine dehydrogenase accessory protein MauD